MPILTGEIDLWNRGRDGLPRFGVGADDDEMRCLSRWFIQRTMDGHGGIVMTKGIRNEIAVRVETRPHVRKGDAERFRRSDGRGRQKRSSWCKWCDRQSGRRKWSDRQSRKSRSDRFGKDRQTRLPFLLMGLESIRLPNRLPSRLSCRIPDLRVFLKGTTDPEELLDVVPFIVGVAEGRMEVS